MKYELYYSNGGHGGPYVNHDLACDAARRLIQGDRNMQALEIRPYNSPVKGGYGPEHAGSTYMFREHNQKVAGIRTVLPKVTLAVNDEASTMANEAEAERMLAQHDDDPSPYHGDCSED